MCVTVHFFGYSNQSKDLPHRRLYDAKGSHEEARVFSPTTVDCTHSPIVSHQIADEGGVERTEKVNRNRATDNK